MALWTFSITTFSQGKIISEIEKIVTRPSIEAPLTFLASDEMRGRNTGSQELDIAANYIANEFQQLGIKPVAGPNQYFQPIEFERSGPPDYAQVELRGTSYQLSDQFVILEGSGEWSGDAIFVGYGAADEMPADMRGKVIVSIAGSKNSIGREPIFEASEEKLNRIVNAGGIALIEITPPSLSWNSVKNSFARKTRVTLKKGRKAIPHIWLNEANVSWSNELQAGQSIKSSFKIVKKTPLQLKSKNVAGTISGTDPLLKGEYLVISAHYDHLGVDVNIGPDSIYNGARDNALGVVAMMSAARFFSKHPPKRSVLFLAFTAEEQGLLGSYWYADHPLVPLNQTVFNFNCDGAGYTDKTSATIIGLTRTSANESLSISCKSFGLIAARDSVLDKMIFAGTDAFNFIKRGVPSICFCPGFKTFNEELLKYYHKPADEVATLDFDYLLKYTRAFVLANYLIANDRKRPNWTKGDPYEPVGTALYQR